VVSGAHHPEAAQMIAQVARAQGAPLYQVLRETETPLPEPLQQAVHEAAGVFLYTPLPSPTDSAVRVRYGSWELALQPYLIGDYQRHNTACAVAAALLLRERGYTISEAAIERGVSEARIPGRLQIVSESPKVVLDGAHNPDAAAVLAHALPRLFKYRRLIMVFGMLTPHEPADTLRHLLPIADVVVFTPVSNSRTHSAETLMQSAQAWLAAKPHRAPRTLLAATDPQHAFELALALADIDDLVLITGSFYLVGEWRLQAEGG
ncbi:MAG: cyanophycin synthetase, partial [Armatimonadota bacterium]|nr:cyanophycin synthetase [Armatimonadota bacterium]